MSLPDERSTKSIERAADDDYVAESVLFRFMRRRKPDGKRFSENDVIEELRGCLAYGWEHHLHYLEYMKQHPAEAGEIQELRAADPQCMLVAIAGTYGFTLREVLALRAYFEARGVPLG